MILVYRKNVTDSIVRMAQSGCIGGVVIPHLLFIMKYNKKSNGNEKGVEAMKGYTTENGYMGFVNGIYQLFASEADYREWMED